MSGLRLALPLLLGLAALRPGGPAGATQLGVRPPHPARRIVSLNPSTTELLFAIGAGPQVVARTRWCDWPPEATRRPSVGDGFPPNIEAVLARHPDLVVIYPTGLNDGATRRLGELGIPVLALRTDRIEDLAGAARRLGAASGHTRAADSLARAIESALVRARQAAAVGAVGPRVAILAWTTPPLVLGAGSYLHEVVELAGGRNVFGDVARASAPVSLEAIAARDPDLILLAGGTPSALLGRPEWRAVRAVREGRVVALSDPALARPTPRALAAIAPLRERLARVAISSSQELAR